ncbi:unnamed protein product [Leptosia nina]|uniref:Protein MIS12 homolog n=1 Tax=Leptosia nina TaxID=320188 RepID=A0AAV1K3W4_9NEOP
MIRIPPWTGGTDEEYSTQHFGFGPQRLKISVRQMVEEKIRNCVTKGISDLQTSLGLNETDRASLAHSRDKLIRLYCERAGPSLDVVDTEIDRTLLIPPNTLLPEDEEQIEQVSEDEYNALKEEVSNLRKSIVRGALMEVRLTAEDKELSSVEKVWELTKKDMEVTDLIKRNLNNQEKVKAIKNKVNFLNARTPFVQSQDKICSKE